MPSSFAPSDTYKYFKIYLTLKPLNDTPYSINTKWYLTYKLFFLSDTPHLNSPHKGYKKRLKDNLT